MSGGNERVEGTRLSKLLDLSASRLFRAQKLRRGERLARARRNYRPSLMQLEERRLLALNVLDLTQGLTAQSLAQTLVGPGVTISNVVYTGDNSAAGTFTQGDSEDIGIDAGIVLSSGKVKDLPGPNQSSISGSLGTPGDATLTSLLTGSQVTRDAAILEFDFVPLDNILTFTYVFGSEEYPEFAPPNSSNFNDVFGFFVNGQNVALLPNSQTIVSISNVNAVTNSEYYRDNRIVGGAAPLPAELDGFTVALVGVANVNPGVVNHIKMGVADAQDTAFDSAVFIRAGSFVSFPTLTLEAIDDIASENPSDDHGTYRVTRGGNLTNPLVVEYTITSNATANLDYVELSGEVTIPAGEATVDFDLVAIDDQLVDPGEFVTATLKANPAYNIDPLLSSGTVTILSDDSIPLEDPDDQIVEAIPVTSTSLTSGVIAYGTDVDMYVVEIVEGDVISFDIDIPNVDLDSYIRLFDASGTQLSFNDNGLGFSPEFSALESQLQYSFAASGKFYIAVSGSGNGGFNPITGDQDINSGTIGNYQIRLSSLDIDDQFAEAIPLAIPSVTNERVRVADDVNIYSISVSEGQSITIDIDIPNADLHSLLKVFNSQGEVIDVVSSTVGPAPEFSGAESYLELTFATAGIYYIGISSVGNGLYDALSGGGDSIGHTKGNYRLILANNPGDPDDQISEAIPLPFNQVVRGSIAHGYDANMYALNVTAGQRLGIDVDIPSISLSSLIRLFKSDGTLLASNDVGAIPGPIPEYYALESYLEYTFPTTDTYFVGVSGGRNKAYDPVTGTGDRRGVSVGEYTIRVANPESAIPAVTIIDNGDAGFIAQGWTNFAAGYQGDLVYAGPNSNLQASWNFNNLLPGNYRVSSTWTPHANRSDKAPFSVNGAAPVLVNQRIMPSGLSANDTNWKDLGNVVVVDGQLLVTLNSVASGFVIADAIRIERVSPLPSVPRLQVLDGAIELSPTTPPVSFGAVPFQQVVTRQFYVVNRSGGILQLANLQAPPGFDIVSGLDKTSLITNESASFTIGLRTDSVGVKSGPVTIDSNDPNRASFSFNVTGDVIAPPQTVIIDDGDPGYSHNGFVTYTSVGHLNDLSAADANSGLNAQWSFGGLLPGEYRVSTTWVPHANRALKAPFTVNNSAPIFVNQRFAPNDEVTNGTAWENLGTFTVLDNNINVRLTSTTQGYVIADAVRIERIAIYHPNAEIDISADGTLLTSGVSQASFGDVAFQSNAEKTFTVTNSGLNPLTLTTLVVSPGFFVKAGIGQPTLGSGESTTFTIGMNTTQPGGRSGVIQLSSNDSDENPFQINVVGNVMLPANVQFVDDGDAGFSAPGFTPFASGYQGDLHYAAKNSAAPASWTFDNLMPGEYRVSATWVPHANRATDAPYSLNNGPEIRVNQRNAPSSFNELGTAWYNLGTINIVANQGQIVVRLGTNANAFVIADAIRIERLPPAPPPPVLQQIADSSDSDDDELLVDHLFASGDWM